MNSEKLLAVSKRVGTRFLIGALSAHSILNPTTVRADEKLPCSPEQEAAYRAPSPLPRYVDTLPHGAYYRGDLNPRVVADFQTIAVSVPLDVYNKLVISKVEGRVDTVAIDQKNYRIPCWVQPSK